eukprot:7680-Heterococcus_DN1.PRE.1
MLAARHPSQHAQQVRQGRCTLVTTLQVYKCLHAKQPVLVGRQTGRHTGIRYTKDKQRTAATSSAEETSHLALMLIVGLAVAALFFATSRSLPLAKLSRERPPSRIFCTE